MKNSKCQELSNPLSLGLESKDSTRWAGKSAFRGDCVQVPSDPSEADQAYVEQRLMGLLVDVGLFCSP